jgi:hypothetical protein
MVPLLGSWHPLKMACNLLWRRAGHYFLGPLAHCLSPQGNFRSKKNRLSAMTYLFSVIRLSFPQWKADLLELLNDKKFERDSVVLHRHATNLYQMASYIIPVVIFNCLCLSLCCDPLVNCSRVISCHYDCRSTMVSAWPKVALGQS